MTPLAVKTAPQHRKIAEENKDKFYMHYDKIWVKKSEIKKQTNERPNKLEWYK